MDPYPAQGPHAGRRSSGNSGVSFSRAARQNGFGGIHRRTVSSHANYSLERAAEAPATSGVASRAPAFLFPEQAANLNSHLPPSPSRVPIVPHTSHFRAGAHRSALDLVAPRRYNALSHSHSLPRRSISRASASASTRASASASASSSMSANASASARASSSVSSSSSASVCASTSASTSASASASASTSSSELRKALSALSFDTTEKVSSGGSKSNISAADGVGLDLPKRSHDVFDCDGTTQPVGGQATPTCPSDQVPTASHGHRMAPVASAAVSNHVQLLDDTEMSDALDCVDSGHLVEGTERATSTASRLSSGKATSSTNRLPTLPMDTGDSSTTFDVVGLGGVNDHVKPKMRLVGQVLDEVRTDL